MKFCPLLLFGAILYQHSISATHCTWDYLVFTLEWPGTFCKLNTCSFPADNITSWNIHGLWPSNGFGEDPYYCHGAPKFDVKKLKGIHSQLMNKWANLLCYENPSKFWKREWDKHGTCAICDQKLSDEFAYFSAALDIEAKVGIGSSLANAGIVPSDSITYNESMVLSAIQTTLQVTPRLRCINYENQLFLSAIEICLDPDLHLTNCTMTQRYLIDTTKEFLSSVFRNIRLSLKNQFETTPINHDCHQTPFLLPMIDANER